MKHINSAIHWRYDINVVMYPFAKIQIIPSFDPWKTEASDAFEKISSSISKYLQSSLPQGGKELKLENEAFELQASSISSKTKECGRSAESPGNSNKLDNFCLSVCHYITAQVGGEWKSCPYADCLQAD